MQILNLDYKSILLVFFYTLDVFQKSMLVGMCNFIDLRNQQIFYLICIIHVIINVPIIVTIISIFHFSYVINTHMHITLPFFLRHKHYTILYIFFIFEHIFWSFDQRRVVKPLIVIWFCSKTSSNKTLVKLNLTLSCFHKTNENKVTVNQVMW